MSTSRVISDPIEVYRIAHSRIFCQFNASFELCCTKLIGYDTIRYDELTCAHQLMSSQLRTEPNKKSNEETKTKKNGDAQKKRSSRRVREASPDKIG